MTDLFVKRVPSTPPEVVHDSRQLLLVPLPETLEVEFHGRYRVGDGRKENSVNIIFPGFDFDEKELGFDRDVTPTRPHPLRHPPKLKPERSKEAQVQERPKRDNVAATFLIKNRPQEQPIHRTGI
nr:hypothetical protein Itr_chr13CG14770 [Ipomoea trifida]